MHYIIFIFSLLIFNLSLSQNWQSTDDYPGTAVDDGISFTIGDTTFLGTGLSPWWSETREFYAFNHISESWFPIASLPIGQERQYACGFSINGKGYAFGGIRGGQFLNDLWEYDPIVDQWTPKDTLPGIGRSGASCFILNGIAYILGGKTNNQNAIKEVWSYDPMSNSWTQEGDLPIENWRGTACSNDQKGYLFGGVDDAGNYSNILHEFNPGTPSWNPLTSFSSVGRAYSKITILDSKVYLLFGTDSIGNFYNDLWQFDTLTTNWTSLDPLPSIPRRGGLIFRSNQSIFYSCGLDSTQNRTNETWKYNPVLSIPEESSCWSDCCTPNPTRELLYYKTGGKIDIPTKIYSLKGELLLDEKTNGSIRVQHLNSGVYFLVLEMENRIIQERFVKE
ncbi:MAG: T9SS type A sorting domain-containing protein [Crocinitomicaceae bacterium]|nr:T9SS type A sorting domain-containing protein [Crocinitomicaceae bacterium]